MAAFDMLATVSFRNLFDFVVLHHGSRRILHAGVAEHPTAEWTGSSSLRWLGPDAPEVTHLIRDLLRSLAFLLHACLLPARIPGLWEATTPV